MRRVIALLFAVAVMQGSCFAASANDDFANAQVLAVPGTATIDTTGNTLEAGEPTLGMNTMASAWFKITPAVNGRVTVSTRGSAFDTQLGVFEGTAVNMLFAVAAAN